MSSASSVTTSPSPTARIEQLDNIEKDVIGILQNAAQFMQDISKDRPSQKATETSCQQVVANIKSVEAKLSEQIKYLTQVSTGHPHEGSSYPSQKILQTAWHRLEHARSRLSDLSQKQAQQQQQQQQVQQPPQPQPSSSTNTNGTAQPSTQ